MAYSLFQSQAVKFAKNFAIFTACFCFFLSANAKTVEKVASPAKLCTYFYDFNFHDPQLKKLEVRQAIKAMVFSNRIKYENGEINYHILPKSLQVETESHWSPIAVEQLLIQSGIRSKSPLYLNILFENQKPHNVIGRQISRVLAQSDLIRVNSQAVKKSELIVQRNKGNYQLIRSEQCVEKPNVMLFLARFASTHSENLNGYANAEVDKLLVKLQTKKLNNAKRVALIQQLIEILEQDVAILPLYEFSK
ncbi:oligopeptide transporter periplasmic-binding protein [Haemophilus parahaemolyticus]|uniref:Oligopeptide transporter periplasmic-binding protein n=1 Tax=Haemophilus parahaemolyticus TaxID=735 RepID=A0A377I3R8_HAEPH|nr:ABC transporter substrate-binding protein [Haemophilus parahaemolyticus]STO65104.1 oligopeptide transporter periplasmic-binding protein [Haemophilus parahaemolyticus]